MTPQEYINLIPYNSAWTSLSSSEQDNFIAYASLVLTRHFGEQDWTLYPDMVGEEAIYLAQSPMIFENLFQKYEGLKKFDVKDAVGGEVWTDAALSELSMRVKQIAGLHGLEEEIPDMTSTTTLAFGAY